MCCVTRFWSRWLQHMSVLIRGLWPCVNSNGNLSATFQLPDKHLDKRMKQVVSWSNSFPFLVTNPWEPEKRAIKHFPLTFMKQWSAVFRKFFVVVENGNENIWSNNISFKLLFWILFSLFILSNFSVNFVNTFILSPKLQIFHILSWLSFIEGVFLER